MSGTRSSSMHIRVNPEIKEKVEPILSAIGLSFSDVFNLMMNQIYLKKRIPFEISSLELTENGYTREFEEEVLRVAEADYAAMKNGTAKVYNSTAEMFAEWDEEDDEEELRNSADVLFNSLGMDTSKVIREFLKAALEVGGIPLSLNTKENNDKTLLDSVNYRKAGGAYLTEEQASKYLRNAIKAGVNNGKKSI